MGRFRELTWAVLGAVLVDRHGLFTVPKHHDIRDVVPQPGNGPPWLGFCGAAPFSTNKEDPGQFREQSGKTFGILCRLERRRIAQKVLPSVVRLVWPSHLPARYDARMIWVGWGVVQR
jgi:hypothetical protein